MSVLVIQSGKHKGKKITLPDGEAVIGRDEGCFIRLASTDVSRRHCLLCRTSRGLLIRDLGSQNGTIVNQVAIESETILQPGDMIRVGPIQFQVDVARTAPRPVPKIDDSIAEWLTDSDTSTEIPVGSGDTAVMKVGEPAPAAAEDVAARKPPVVKPEKPKFATVAEEARDIIRRHLESLPADN